MAPVPGEIPFALAKRHLADALAVSDLELMYSVAYATQTLKLLVEPSGAAGLAALISGKYVARGKAVAAVLTGANGDLSTIVEACAQIR
jgi:threonine dehydratase